MQEVEIGEAEGVMRVKAGETLKAELPDTNIAVSLSNENRTFEPWVIEARASKITTPFKQFSFSPLHQRPSAPIGQTGVGTGFVVVGRMCPGMCMGIYHPQGEEAVERWVRERQTMLVTYFSAEIVKVKREIIQKDIVTGPEIPTPPDDVVQGVLDHLRFFQRGLENWHSKIKAGDLSSVPRMEG